MITNLIEPCMGKLILNHLFGNNCPRVLQWASGQLLFQTTLGSDCLELFLESPFPSQNHPDSVILQKYQSLSNRNFKHNAVHMLPLNLTSRVSFKSRFRLFMINGYSTKSKRLYSLFNNNLISLCVLIMSRTRFWVNPPSIAAWMSRNSLLEAGAKSEGQVTATGLEPRTT